MTFATVTDLTGGTTSMWRLIHHCLAHPLMGIFGDNSWAGRFHDWTAEKWAAPTGSPT